jgi:hypothetical protein
MKCVVVTCVALASIGLLACDPCEAGEARVKKVGGGSVCVPTSRGDPEGSPVGPTEPYEPYDSMTIPAGAGGPSPSPAPDAAAPSACRTEDPGELTVVVVAKGGAAPALVASPPPDGRYALVQATSFGSDGGAPAVSALRAEVVVQGAVWVIGARAVAAGSSLASPESATLSVVGETATHVCAASAASVVSWLLPPIGATTRAIVSWDDGTSTLTMVLTTPGGADVELVFSSSR